MAEVAAQFGMQRVGRSDADFDDWSIPARAPWTEHGHRGAHGAHGSVAWSAEVAWMRRTHGDRREPGENRHALTSSRRTTSSCRSRVARILGIGNRLGRVRGGWGHACYRLQWRDRRFYALAHRHRPHARKEPHARRRWWCPTNTSPISSVGASMVTGRFSCTRTAITPTRKATYVYERLYVSLVSASRPFVELGARDGRHGSSGSTARSTTSRGVKRARPIWTLRTRKRESLRLLPWMYALAGRAVSGAQAGQGRAVHAARLGVATPVGRPRAAGHTMEGMLWGACRGGKWQTSRTQNAGARKGVRVRLPLPVPPSLTSVGARPVT